MSCELDGKLHAEVVFSYSSIMLSPSSALLSLLIRLPKGKGRQTSTKGTGIDWMMKGVRQFCGDERLTEALCRLDGSLALIKAQLLRQVQP